MVVGVTSRGDGLKGLWSWVSIVPGSMVLGWGIWWEDYTTVSRHTLVKTLPPHNFFVDSNKFTEDLQESLRNYVTGLPFQRVRKIINILRQ